MINQPPLCDVTQVIRTMLRQSAFFKELSGHEHVQVETAIEQRFTSAFPIRSNLGSPTLDTHVVRSCS